MHPRRVEGTSQLNLRRDSKITCGLATVTFTFAFAVTDAVVVVFAFAKQFRVGRARSLRLALVAVARRQRRRSTLWTGATPTRVVLRVEFPNHDARRRPSHRLRPRGKLVVSPSPRKLRRNGVARLAADPSSRPRRCISRVRALRILPRPGAILLSELADSLRSTRHAEDITSRANAPGDRLLAMQCVASPHGAPFADTFCVDSRVRVATRGEGGCVVEVLCAIDWKKPVNGMIRKLVVRGARDPAFNVGHAKMLEMAPAEGSTAQLPVGARRVTRVGAWHFDDEGRPRWIPSRREMRAIRSVRSDRSLNLRGSSRGLRGEASPIG